MSSEMKYDVIVTGAGEPGLRAALSSARDGKKVLVLDKNNRPGGGNTLFRRGKFEFRTADGSPEDISALEAELHCLGGEIRYKSRAESVAPFADHYEVSMGHGEVLCCGQVIDAGDQDGAGFTVWFGLDDSVDLPGGGNVLRLSKACAADAFEQAGPEGYFRLKDETVKAIAAAFEKQTGTDLRGHILEMDAASPLTRYRYASGSSHPASATADRLHPSVQFCRAEKVIDRGHAKSFVIGPDPERGTETLAYFRAGQYISIAQRIGENIVCKPYSICSGPGDVLGKDHTTYTVMIERNPEGFFSPHALDTWEPGTKLILSGPLGYAYHMPVRDADHVVALAGSSGITPFFSMASAIADGIEDFDLTILYGSGTFDTILLRDELDELVRRSGGKVRVVHVLSDERHEGCEYGFITPELIRKYAPAADYSIYSCGPAAMYDFLRRELPKLCLPAGRIRFELPGEFGDPAADPEYPAETAGKAFTVTIRERGAEKTLQCRSEQTLMQAIERSGIMIEADCRSGQCGWCRSRLVSGRVFVPKSRDGRLSGDAENGWVHPCVTYPLSDVVLEIFNH